MKRKNNSELDNFTEMLKRVVSVPHSEIKAKLDEEKAAKKKKKKERQ
jgi:hypothetical protein